MKNEDVELIKHVLAGDENAFCHACEKIPKAGSRARLA